MRGQRIERGLVRAFVEKFRQCFFLGPPHVHRFAIHNLSHVRRRIIHIADQNCLRWTNDDASRLESDVDTMCAEVALLGRVIFGVDENSIVWARGHTRFAADAD